MPWMLQLMIDYTTRIFKMIPEFIFWELLIFLVTLV
jgi:hypothetical protein